MSLVGLRSGFRKSHLHFTGVGRAEQAAVAPAIVATAVLAIVAIVAFAIAVTAALVTAVRVQLRTTVGLDDRQV